MPKINVNDSICFSAYTSIGDPILHYIVNVSNNAGQTHLTGSYSIAQCLPLTSEECGRFNVSVTAVNVFGASNVTDFEGKGFILLLFTCNNVYIMQIQYSNLLK